MIKSTKKKILIGSGILFFLYLLKSKKNMFFDQLVKFLLKQEGGLSNDPIDSASAYPSPTPEKYHTNKGVTYKTFVDSAKALNYAPTIENFINMPSEIWLKIYKEKYLKQATKLNLSKNDIINAYLSLWYWGGWAQSITPLSAVKSILNSKTDNKTKLKDLVNLRIDYFNKLVTNKPSYKKYIKGWTNRQNEFLNDFSKYV